MTAKKYLLDTNIISDLVRRPRGVVADRIRLEGEHSICTSVVVAAELRFGARKSGSTRLQRQVEQVLSRLLVLPLEEPADEAYAQLRHSLESRGKPIGPNDMLIAAQALALDCTVVTASDREFGRVPGLRVQNWLQQ
jgi:tRNA(fMet)-specific endonuclease VapC